VELAFYFRYRFRTGRLRKKAVEPGEPVAPASDHMPGPYEPMVALQSMVMRRDFRGREWGANQRITVAEALRICTVSRAYASFDEDLKGSIARSRRSTEWIEGPQEESPEAGAGFRC
jgi:predicted amidohydrolase YtcJ